MAHFTEGLGNLLHISQVELINCIFFPLFSSKPQHYTLHSKTAYQSISLNKGRVLLKGSLTSVAEILAFIDTVSVHTSACMSIFAHTFLQVFLNIYIQRNVLRIRDIKIHDIY